MWVGKRGHSVTAFELGDLYDSGVRVQSTPSRPVPAYYILSVYRDIMLVPREVRDAFYDTGAHIDVVVGNTVMEHPLFTEEIGRTKLYGRTETVAQCGAIGPTERSGGNGFIPGVITTDCVNEGTYPGPLCGSITVQIYYIGVDYFVWGAAMVMNSGEDCINPEWDELYSFHRERIGIPEGYPATNALADMAMIATMYPEYTRKAIPAPIVDYVLKQRGMEVLRGRICG